MKKITQLFFLLFTFIGFSQTKNEIHGKVVSQELAIKNADVINFTNKKSTTTNENGEFYIEAKANDIIIVLSKEYYDKKFYISKYDFNKTLITIQLEAKPIELDDVKIRAKESVKNIVTYDDLAQIRIAKENSPLRNPAVYDGKIINGMDFFQIGKMIVKGIGKLFKGDRDTSKKTPSNIDFKDFAKANFTNDFFIETLELKQDEIDLFLNFCEADPKSKEIIATEDEFMIMDFLVSKKAPFLTLSSETKK